jgi:hypothetical protein
MHAAAQAEQRSTGRCPTLGGRSGPLQAGPCRAVWVGRRKGDGRVVLGAPRRPVACCSLPKWQVHHM